MPEIMTDKIVPKIPTEDGPRSSRFPLAHGLLQHGVFWTGVYGADLDGAARDGVPAASTKPEDPELPWLRINWEIKALVPIASFCWAECCFFCWRHFRGAIPNATWSCWSQAQAQSRFAARFSSCSPIRCSGPWSNCSRRSRNSAAAISASSVSFAHRNDEIGDLGRNFNQMVQQLRESRNEIERLHRTQMSRAEHLATLGEMATGLAHEIRNPLAGIAGVIEIIGRDLPSTSPARAVVKDVRQEIARINHIVTDLLQTARPHPPKVRKSDLNTTVEHAVMLGRQQALAKSIEIALHKDHHIAGSRARQRSDPPGAVEPAAECAAGHRREWKNLGHTESSRERRRSSK